MASQTVSHWDRSGYVDSARAIQYRWNLSYQKTSGSFRQLTSDEHMEPYPTVLVAVGDEETRQFLANRLREDKCHVLEADSRAHMMDLVRFHSRPIHLLVQSVDISDPASDALLNSYRSAMHVMYVRTCFHESGPEAFLPEQAVTRAREMLNPLR